MGDNGGSGGGSAVSLDAGTERTVKSEILCFILDKCNILPFDDLVKICVDFYTEDEIVEGRGYLDGVGPRMPKRKGADKCRATVEDLVRIVLNPDYANSLPVFYATNLARLPPVDLKHCDTAALLVEIQSLRAEVRALKALKDDVINLQQQLSTMALRSSLTNDVADLRREMSEIKNSMAAGTTLDADSHSFPEVGRGTLHGSEQSAVGTSILIGRPIGTSYAAQVRALRDVGMSRENRKPQVKHVVGLSTANQRVKSVQTCRTIDIFVSRLDPSTDDESIVECISAVKGDLNVFDVKCVRLKSRYEELYCSYHVAVDICAGDMKKGIELLLCADSWPVGVYLRRYFKPKNVSNQ